MIPVNPQNINFLSAIKESPGRAMCRDFLHQSRISLQHDEPLSDKFASRMLKSSQDVVLDVWQ